MDGFDSSKGVVIIAATNRPEILDKALLRPGRFDRRIVVNLPDLVGRVDILKVHIKNVIMDTNIDLKVIARATAGASGADLENIINEGALRAVRNGRNKVTQKDLEDAVEVILAGEEKKNKVLLPEEKRIVAYHEIGHALVSALLSHTEPIHKITIIPRTMGSLGYTLEMPKDEKNLVSKNEAVDRITVLAGGRAAEKLVFDSITTGASNDIEVATDIARSMITVYGMSDEFGFMSLEKQTNTYLPGAYNKNYSDETAFKIDSAVKDIVNSALDKAQLLLSENRTTLDKAAAVLIEKENITGDEFIELLRSDGINVEKSEK
jgi:cell division protease FtsH